MVDHVSSNFLDDQTTSQKRETFLKEGNENFVSFSLMTEIY